MRFFLGTGEPWWLWRTEVPLFISARRMSRVAKIRRRRDPWMLDSGGFTELNLYGKWMKPAKEYATEVRLWNASVGRLVGAAIQDWMCEEVVLKKTGLTVEEHQRRTVDSYIELSMLAPDAPWVPVLQGYTLDDYLRCRDRYDALVGDRWRQGTVGLGTICRREGTKEAELIVTRLAQEGLRLHTFGAKVSGLIRYAHLIESSDSLAWTIRAQLLPHEACSPKRTHKACTSCLPYALWWRERLLKQIAAGTTRGFDQKEEEAESL